MEGLNPNNAGGTASLARGHADASRSIEVQSSLLKTFILLVNSQYTILKLMPARSFATKAARFLGYDGYYFDKLM